MEITITIPKQHKGPGINPASTRQRVHAVVAELLRAGTYPSMEHLRAAFPKVRDSTLDNYRRELFRRVGLDPYRTGSVQVDLSKLDTATGR